MKVAVVILNWNGKKLLKEFLPSVIEESKEADIYIIDNHSDKEEIDFIKTHFPSVNLIINNENFGFAKGYNQGLKSIDADIYCLLNSDVQVSKNWLTPIIDLFTTQKHIAAIQPKILSYKQKDYFEYAGAGGGFIDNLGYPFCRGRVFDTVEKDESQYNDTTPIFWASGACLFIRSSVFWESGGFDEDFFAHMEEIDLCWRIQHLGYSIYYCGHSTVYHLGGGTLNKTNPKKTFLNFRNNLLMLAKNLPTYKLLPIIFTRLCLDGVSAVMLWKKEGFSHLKAIFYAHMSFYKNLFKFLKKRKTIKLKKYYNACFIPFQYFILKRKKYNELS